MPCRRRRRRSSLAVLRAGPIGSLALALVGEEVAAAAVVAAAGTVERGKSEA